MAATIFSSVKNDDKLLVASRGMVVLFDEPYNPKAVAVCAAHDMIMRSFAFIKNIQIVVLKCRERHFNTVVFI